MNTKIDHQAEMPAEHELLYPFLSLERTYGSPSLGQGHPLTSLMVKLFKKKHGVSELGASGQFLEASFWNLDRTQLYQGLPEAQQGMLLRLLGNFTLTYMYFIEKSGFNLCSKLILLAESKEEKSFYALMAADEARHLAGVERFLTTPELDQSYKGHKIFDLFSEVIQSGSAASIVLIMQVFLEGFGIHHYGEILKSSRHLEFQNFIKSVLADEAYHYGGGKIIFNQKTMTEKDVSFCANLLEQLIGIFKLGEAEVILRILKEFGVTKDLIDPFLRELNPAQTSLEFVKALESLIEGAQPEVHARLKERDTFKAVGQEDFLALGRSIFA